MGKPIIWSGSNAKLINSGDFVDSKNNSLTNAAKINITKTGHGWTTSDIGRPLYLNGSTWTLAQADTEAAAEVAGFIYAIIDVDTVRLALGGQIPTVGANLLEGGGNLVAGEAYFLSATTAGKITATAPTVIGYVSKPIGIATSTTTLLTYNFRGAVVGGANARTQITLSNNTTADVLDVAAYDAGEIVGWVYIDATTDYRFLIKAQFAKNGAGTNWNLSYQTVGDTPPATFSLSITSGGKIQYTMPNVAGYSTAYLNYALNAPAVGTTFPLSIDGAAIVSGTVSASYLPVASNSVSGIINTSAQNIAGVKTFYDGLKLDDAAGQSILSWYEENTWTPSFASSGGGAPASYAVRVGAYTRIGRVVYFTCRISASNTTGLNAGNLSVSGLPYTSSSASNIFFAVNFAEIEGLDYPAGALELYGQIANSTSIALVFSRDNTTPIAVTVANISTATYFTISGWYHV